ncbi:flagellar hook-length control protein FliK [Thermodesulfatator indicus]
MKLNSLTMVSNGNVSNLSLGQGIMAGDFLALFMMLLGQEANNLDLPAGIQNQQASPEDNKNYQGMFLTTNLEKNILKKVDNLKEILKTKDNSEESPENIVILIGNILKEINQYLEEINQYLENFSIQEREKIITNFGDTIKELKNKLENLINILKENFSNENKEILNLANNKKDSNILKLEKILSRIKSDLNSLEENLSEQNIVLTKKNLENIINDFKSLSRKDHQFEKISQNRKNNASEEKVLAINQNTKKNNKNQILISRNIPQKEELFKKVNFSSKTKKDSKENIDNTKNTDNLITTKKEKEGQHIKVKKGVEITENTHKTKQHKELLTNLAEKKDNLIAHAKITTNTEIETTKHITINKEIHHSVQNFKPEEIPNFVKELVLKTYPQGKHEARIKLDPPELGELHVTVSVDKGEVKLLLTVGHAKAAEALHQHLHQLSSSLENLGLQFGGAEINLAQDYSEGSYQQESGNYAHSMGIREHTDENKSYENRHNGIINIVV